MIREVRLEDAKRLVEIYDYYVTSTAITFEYATPSIEEFTNRIQHTLEHYPYIVYEDKGVVLGYGYVGPLKGRAAYDWSVETSIYVDHNAKKMGIGRKIYEALEEICAKMHITNMYACISAPKDGNDPYLDTNSMDFHAHMGYKEIARFHTCGYKFDHWYDMVWYEKIIGEHQIPMPSIINYQDMKKA
ncbi:MAG TPA: GNAT family N-acetyltransferase [Erysipelotrichaceae bacterium]|nr:GNAT family N-acetyltransferase [Erysipelotrichaceae bacterium]